MLWSIEYKYSFILNNNNKSRSIFYNKDDIYLRKSIANFYNSYFSSFIKNKPLKKIFLAFIKHFSIKSPLIIHIF